MPPTDRICAELRDEERNAFRAQLESAHAYAHQLEAQLMEAKRLRGDAIMTSIAVPQAQPQPTSMMKALPQVDVRLRLLPRRRAQAADAQLPAGEMAPLTCIRHPSDTYPTAI